MLTAAIRDLHTTYPELDIAVTAPSQYLWKNNPHIATIFKADQLIRLGYETPRMRGFLGAKHHFIYAFHDALEKELGVEILRGDPHPDIYLTEEEKQPVIAADKPILLVNAGSKADCPIKQWPLERFQAVVNAVQDTYTVIQIGDAKNAANHVKLDGVVNMLGATPGRRLLSLMYQASAVLTGVSYPMHLCAAINAKDDKKRKCVVLAGNREDEYWERYVGHNYLMGKTRECCQEHGCWRRRLDPETPDLSCLHIETDSAACMRDITVDQVVKCLK